MFQYQTAKVVVVLTTVQQFQSLKVPYIVVFPVYFNKCNIMERNTVYTLMGTADAFGRDTKNLVMVRTSF